MPRATVVMEFTNSHEYHMDEVATWYPKYLGRPADAAGQGYWANVLDNNGRDELIEAGFIGSPEYFLTAASDPTQPGIPRGRRSRRPRGRSPARGAYCSSDSDSGSGAGAGADEQPHVSHIADPPGGAGLHPLRLMAQHYN